MPQTKLLQSTGSALDYTPSADKAAGDIVVVGDLVGQVPTDLKANELGALRITGVISGPKKAADDAPMGTPIHWDESESEFTITSSGNKQAGYAAADAGASTTTIKVVLGR